MINKTDYDNCLAHFNLLGCGIRSKDIFYFLAQEDYTQSSRWKQLKEAPDDDDLERRVVSLMRAKPADKQWSKSALEGFAGILGAVTMLPKAQFVVSSSGSAVFAIGSGEAGLEPTIPVPGATTRLRTVGSHVYAAASGRNLFRRESAGTWTAISKGIPKNKTRANEISFRDVAGFDEQDLYAVGGAGDVWRFDGATWKQCAFPTNQELYTVCCGGDGNVYVSGLQGVTFVGRGDKWTPVHSGNLSIPFKDMVWYEDRVWCASDYGLWWIKEGQLAEAEVPAKVKVCSGYLAAREGILLVCGFGGAAFRESGSWEVIFQHSDFR